MAPIARNTLNRLRNISARENQFMLKTTTAKLHVICPKHGRVQADSFIIWAAMLLKCGCKVTSVSGKPWVWEFAK